MPTVKIRTNRQVTVPKVIFDDLGLKEGDYVDVSRQGNDIVIRPECVSSIFRSKACGFGKDTAAAAGLRP